MSDVCLLCDEPIGPVPVTESDQTWAPTEALRVGPGAAHRACLLREVMGGIGHLTDHAYWCRLKEDPDGGLSRLESALAVWDLVAGTGPMGGPT